MSLAPFRYQWPLSPSTPWEDAGLFRTLTLPESRADLARDSRWPAFFPAPICLITTRSGKHIAIEKVVGASIVNRFPYVLAVSFCRTYLSDRHHPRTAFMQLLEESEQATVQFLPPGPALQHTLRTILEGAESETTTRLARLGLEHRPSCSNDAPVLDEAYMAYEARFVQPSTDFAGNVVHAQPWQDVGSHRVYFMEINAIQLREDIAGGATQLQWRSLPDWSPSFGEPRAHHGAPSHTGYQKGFTADYRFPARETVAFEADEWSNSMAIKHLPPLARDQVEVDNDRARWPCFFPSSVGMITCQTPDGGINVMPCGSTTIVARDPLTIAIAVSYASINARYAPRASLDYIRQAGRFGCGIPYRSSRMLDAIRHCGQNSYRDNPAKVQQAGFTSCGGALTPRLNELPIHYDCRVVHEIPLGTHALFLGEVERVYVRRDVTTENPLNWCPWANVPALAKVC